MVGKGWPRADPRGAAALRGGATASAAPMRQQRHGRRAHGEVEAKVKM